MTAEALPNLPGLVCTTDRCLHCGGALSDAGPFCCHGCESVYSLLHREGLERYYALRGATGAPLGDSAAPSDHAWLEAELAKVSRAKGALRVQLDVQGMQCTACVWLFEELFRRYEGALRASVNASLGTMELWVEPRFELRAFVLQVESFGYRLGPARKRESQRSHALTGRLGVCAALAMNTMLFELPVYFGLREGAVYHVFRWTALLLATLSVAVGGSVFFRSAWQGLKARVLHLDVPIALGIALSWAGSVYNFARGRDGAVFLDTVAVFIALMLLGRWLQERVLERNRNALLASAGAEGLLVRALREGKPELVPCTTLREGDTLLLAPGDLVPVRSVLESAQGECSLDWINGESQPLALAAGEELSAGAFIAGRRALRARCAEDFSASRLLALLGSSTDAETPARTSPFWRALTRWYVTGVLALASGGLFVWWALTGDLGRAFEVTTAVLVVTCPCALGLGAPLAYELVQAGLRRAGLFVRSGGFLDRAQAVRSVVFDKTGTLTTGRLELEDRAPLEALSPARRAVLFDLAARSSHPKSAAVRVALERLGASTVEAAREVEETPGCGVECELEGKRYRLGRPGWAGAAEAGGDLLFTEDGALLAELHTREQLRPDAARELLALSKQGYRLRVLSGDTPARVAALVQRLGLAVDEALGGLSAEDKARELGDEEAAAQTLMLGDGLNDGPAFDRAGCSGTPAIDRPFMPARSDFYYTTPGLHPVALALRAARALGRVSRRNLALALAYNALTVGIALAGHMSPLLCAALMPLSSLVLIALTVASLGPGSSLWRS